MHSLVKEKIEPFYLKKCTTLNIKAQTKETIFLKHIKKKATI